MEPETEKEPRPKRIYVWFPCSELQGFPRPIELDCVFCHCGDIWGAPIHCYCPLEGHFPDEPAGALKITIQDKDLLRVAVKDHDRWWLVVRAPNGNRLQFQAESVCFFRGDDA